MIGFWAVHTAPLLARFDALIMEKLIFLNNIYFHYLQGLNSIIININPQIVLKPTKKIGLG